MALRARRPDGGWDEHTWAEVGHDATLLAAAFAELGVRRRGPGAAVRAQPARVPCRGPRGAAAACGTGQPVQLQLGRAGRVPGRALRRARRGRGRARLPRAGAGREGPAAGSARRRHGRRPGRARRTAPGRRAPLPGPAGRDAARRPGRPGRRRRRGQPGRPGHRHLHLRHDRAAQGRDARPRQRGLAGGRVHGPHRGDRARHALGLVPADGARRRADGHALRLAVHPLGRQLLSRPHPAGAGSWPRCARRTCSARRGSGRSCGPASWPPSRPPGPSARRRSRRPSGWARRWRRRGTSPAADRSPTSSSRCGRSSTPRRSRRCGSGPAWTSCGTGSPARRRWPPRCSSSSARSGCRSPRSTACPRTPAA